MAIECYQYKKYIDELAKIEPSLSDMTYKDIVGLVFDYNNDPNVYVLDVKEDNGMNVGFIVILNNTMTNPCVDYHIDQCYVNHLYRRNGLAKRTIVRFINEHSGTYSLDILKGNDVAEKFWKSVFDEVGAVKRDDIPDYRDYDWLTTTNWNVYTK